MTPPQDPHHDEHARRGRPVIKAEDRRFARGPELVQAGQVAANYQPKAPEASALRYVGVGAGGHVSLDTVRAFEAALGRAGVERIAIPARLTRPLGKVLSKVGLLPSRRAASGRPFIVTMMGPVEYRLFPISMLAPIIIYAFDVWPATYDWWARFFRSHGISTAFFTARESADWFATSGILQSAVWLPEGTDIDAFDPRRRLRDRTIDVLEMGRRHPAIHEAIRVPLFEAGIIHLYQPTERQLVFESRGALLRGLANTRISVCYPAIDTHPSLARGGTEVLTQRYLEALASGILIVGRAPADLISLFGFDPVVSLDQGAPAAHLVDILERVDDYQDHVDHALQRVREVGRWDDRVSHMLSLLTRADL